MLRSKLSLSKETVRLLKTRTNIRTGSGDQTASCPSNGNGSNCSAPPCHPVGSRPACTTTI